MTSAILPHHLPSLNINLDHLKQKMTPNPSPTTTAILVPSKGATDASPLTLSGSTSSQPSSSSSYRTFTALLSSRAADALPYLTAHARSHPEEPLYCLLSSSSSFPSSTGTHKRHDSAVPEGDDADVANRVWEDAEVRTVLARLSRPEEPHHVGDLAYCWAYWDVDAAEAGAGVEGRRQLAVGLGPRVGREEVAAVVGL